MSVTQRRRSPRDYSGHIMLAAAMLIVLIVLGLWAAMQAGAAASGAAHPAGNPFAAVILLAAGRYRWPGPIATAVAGNEGLALAAAVAVISHRAWRRRGPRRHVDAAARYLADRQEQHPITRSGAVELAKAIGAPTDPPGVRIGRIIGSGQDAWADWEAVEIDIWGPRKGKTSGRAVPAILDAPGAVIATSNKRDIVDCTRLPRKDVGPVWVFDPQQLVGEPATWWWDPLSYVTDVDYALRLASLWAGYDKSADTKTDGYFDPKGQQLLAFLLLAAAELKAPVTQVYLWVTDSTDTQPVDILQQHGHFLPAKAVQDMINLPDKQRAGIFGTAEKTISFLVNPKITRWLTYDEGRPDRPRFDPHAYAATHDQTLYLLSREGMGTAGQVVTSLAVATIEALEARANRSPRGRLPFPALVAGDEAANCVRWRELPDLYSHYGSKGIHLQTYLQSWSQGVAVWGEQGMSKMWSAANIRVLGGGVSEGRFLGDIATLIGDYEPETTSLSLSTGQQRSRSTTVSTRVEKILDVADLAALPRGRALLLAAGTRPVLVATEQWKEGPHKDRVWESIRQYAPPEDAAAYETDDAETDQDAQANPLPASR